jgi:predicted nucleic acid-binding protein
MKSLLDTNVISEVVAREPDPRVLQWIDSLDPEDVYLSAITVGEVWKGIEQLPSSARKERLRAWLKDDLLVRFAGRVLTIDAEVMRTWGTLVAELERRGRSLPALDSLIAALALHHGCALATRNEADFAGTGVTVVNPWRNGQ